MPEQAEKSREITVSRLIAGIASDMRDEVAIEEPLEIRVRGRAISITMRTPAHDEELAAGFLMGEGLIQHGRQILAIEPCRRNEAGNVINVVLDPLVAVDFEKLTRYVFASSSCGVCGKATVEAIRQQFAPIANPVTFAPEMLFGLPDKMRIAQETFSRTGGLHAAAIFSRTGELIVLREDVGRHNAVDKVVGYSLLHDISLERCLLLVSGRTSFEILQKALAARLPVVAAVSAPSSLAVDFATESGQTLVGFLRGQSMNIYTHAQRINSSCPAEIARP